MAAFGCNVKSVLLVRRLKSLNLCLAIFSNQSSRYLSSQNSRPSFGLLFDIDGVIVRGRKVLPSAPEAFQKLVDNDNKFRVPTVFVTNAGNALRNEKAKQLSEWLGIEVSEDQVVMAHSPLRMFQQYHKKRVLINGQGPIVEIAKNLGFTDVTTLDELRNTFPMLDAVDHKRRITVPCSFEQFFPRMEAIVLFGEPVRWETALQLLVDALMTDGLPNHRPKEVIYPHIPLLACNMDLQWMAEARMPRFGHGAFLLCLENLYKKITGYNLIYTALIGKPSEITYHHAHHMILEQAQNIGLTNSVKRLYAIGDNVYTDIFGANLYDQYLAKRRAEESKRIAHVERSIEHLIGANPDQWDQGAVSCSSILVKTGVYSQDCSEACSLDHSPRDFLPVEEKLRAPKFTVDNVSKAIELIFREECFQ